MSALKIGLEAKMSSYKIFGYEAKQINLDANFTVATAAPSASSPCSHKVLGPMFVVCKCSSSHISTQSSLILLPL